MPTINQLPVLNTISSGDQLPVYSPNNGDARRTSIGSLLTFFQQSFASPSISVNLFVPANGFNITVPTPVSEQQWMLLQPASTLSTGTITLPLNTGVPDGTEVLITSTQEVSLLTIALNGATAIYGNNTLLLAGAALRYRYYEPTNSWYNIVSDLSVATAGDVVGPSSATDNAITRFNSTTGKLVQNSVVTVADDGAIVAPQAGSVIPFYFANQSVFPAAATYHGAIAHSHADGAMYFAHAGSWILLQYSGGPVVATTVAASGSILSTGATGVGYATGAGGYVTQATSRTTGVTLNKTTGYITLYAAAGTTSATTFTVTNSTVAADDVIILNQRSGTDLYDLMVTAVAAGSFNITFRTTGGTTTETPVFNFAVIKGVAA